MAVLDRPRCTNWPLPTRGPERFGHCFLLRLDPAASVAALDDEEAARAASLVPREWFLAVTLGEGGMELYGPDGIRLLNFRFCLIGTALPTDYEPGVVPIAPLNQLVADRPSMTFVPPLHVKGLYVHTYPSSCAVVSRIHDTSGNALSTLTAEQHDQLLEYEARDEYNRSRLLYEKQLADEAERAAGEADPAVGCNADAEQSSESVASGRASDISDIRYLLTAEMQTRFLQVRIFVEVWLDPAFHAGPPIDPAKFEQATEQIEAIWEDWKERMLKETLAKRPQTQEWLQGVQQDGDGGLDDTPMDTGAPYDDHAVLPEDAIDSRIEKDRLARQVACPTVASGTASNDVQSVPQLLPVDSALEATESVERAQPSQRQSNIITRSDQGSVEAPLEEQLSVHIGDEESSTKQVPGTISQPKSPRREPSTAPQRSLALIQVIRSALGRTKVRAARIFKPVNKTAIAS